jgi:hypothetical protein
MKHLLFVMLLVIPTIICAAQVRLGYSEEEIYEEFKGRYEMKPIISDSKEYTLTVNMGDVITGYTFDTKGLCKIVVIVPKKLSTMNRMVKEYNEKYVAQSSTEWIAYFKYGPAHVELIFTDDGKYCFLWYY